MQDDAIVVTMASDLDAEVYNVPVTLKTYVPEGWESAVLHLPSGQADQAELTLLQDSLGSYVLYDVSPDAGEIRLTEASGAAM